MKKTPDTVKLNQIYLDLNNPRHDPLLTEQEAIAHLVANARIKVLAKHISEIGSTSPLELMALVPNPKVKNGFITAEGNRRLCALKLLNDPDKATLDADKRYFHNLKKRMATPITEVLAVKFPSMAEARPWVELRHEGEQGGVGTKEWDSEDKARFNREEKGNNPNVRALEVMDYARNQSLLPEDELEKLSITTLTRFLSTPEVRSAMGLTDSKTLEITVPTPEFEEVLTKFLRDSITENGPVHSRTNAPERKIYAENLRIEGHSPSTRNLPAHTPGMPGEPSNIPTTSAPTDSKDELTDEKLSKINIKKGRNKPNRDNDKFIVPSGFVARVGDPVFQRLFRELRTLDANEFTFSGAYLYRALVEQITLLFLKKHNFQPMPENLNLKLGKAADILKEQGYDGKGMYALRKMASDANSRYSPDTLGNFVHGGAVPTKTDVIKAWDTFQPIMQEFVRQLT